MTLERAGIEHERGYFDEDMAFIQMGTKGPAIVLFEGLRVEHTLLQGMSLLGFRNTFKDWAREARVFQVSRRLNQPEARTISDMAEDYARFFRNKLPFGAHIVGFGVGGAIALHFASRFPALVRSLSLLSSGPRLSMSGQKIYAELIEAARWRKWSHVHGILGRIMFANPIGQLIGGFIASLMSDDLGAPEEPWDFLVTLQAELNHDALPIASEIKSPVLALIGEKDALYSADELKTCMELIPGSRLEISQGKPHGIAKSDSGRVLEKVWRFIREQESHQTAET